MKDGIEKSIGSQLASMRKKKTIVCIVCGKEKHDAIKIAKYCSSACRAKAFKLRKKALAQDDDKGKVDN